MDKRKIPATDNQPQLERREFVKYTLTTALAATAGASLLPHRLLAESTKINSPQQKVSPEVLALTEKLKKLPHLQLPMNFNLAKLQQELAGVTSWSGWSKNEIKAAAKLGKTYSSPEFLDHLNQHYFSSALINSSGKSNVNGFVGSTTPDHKVDIFAEEIQLPEGRFYVGSSNLSYSQSHEPACFAQTVDFLQNARAASQPTELASQFPYTMAFLKRYKPVQARFLKLDPGGEVGMHSDFQFSEGQRQIPYLLQRVHIPIFSNPSAAMVSIDANGTRHEQKYAPGEAWYFNVWNQHTTYNRGDTARIHLCLWFTPADNVAWVKLATQALEKAKLA